MVNDYLNGRFKDTAILRKLFAENKTPLYHFRIQIDDGYIDIIFSNFALKKKAGRVKYLVKETVVRTCKWIDGDTKKAALGGDNFERFLAMQKLFHENDPALPDIARKNLWSDSDGDACLYSAYLLGKLGNMNDISKLSELYLNIEEHLVAKSISRCGSILPKRNIIDAIELAHQRDAISH